MHINLMPPDYIARQALQRQLRVWAWLLAALIACGAMYCGKSLAKVISLQRQIAELSIKHPGLRQMNSEIGQWELELTATQAKKDALDRIRNDKRALTLVGIVAQSLDKAAGKTRLQHLLIRLPASGDGTATTTGNPAIAANSVPAADTGKGSMTLDGSADEADTISRLVALLQQSGALNEVNLKGSSEISTGDEHCRQFKIECSF